MAEAGLSHGLRIAVRSAHLAGASFVVALRLAGATLRAGRDRAARQAALGRALVDLCTRLGATFIKVGQIASTRSDLLPGPVILELSRLRDEVPPFGPAEVESTIRRELGRSIAELFASFELEPVAAASVAQVHRAVLRNGRTVAVKVRRPDIERKARLDRSILLASGRMLERLVPSLRLVALEGALRQFCDAVEEQLDLRIEAENNRRFARNFAGEPGLVIPALEPELCGAGVLTMAFIEGVHERDLERSGMDVHEVARVGMRCVCRMIFLHGFVHADLHPGNMRFLPPAKVALFDLGLVGRVNDPERLRTAQMLFAFATGDGQTVARILHDDSPRARPRDYAAYETEMSEFVGGLQRQGLSRVQLTLEIGRLFDILRRHRIQARSHMTMVNLALMTAEGLGRRLAPDLSLTDEALPYLAEALGQASPAAPAAASGA